MPAARANGHLEEIASHERRWGAQALRDYVFVLEQHSMLRRLDAEKLRVVVANGRVQSASSLLYGGSTDLAFVPTIEALFEQAAAAAQSGRRATPYRFEVSFDRKFDFPLQLWANPRADIADDETGFRVLCFSPRADGCAPVWITAQQCAAARGRTERVADERWCGPSYNSIGLISAEVMCCQDDAVLPRGRADTL